MSYQFKLDLRALAIEWFDLADEVDPVTQTLVNEAMSFAVHTLATADRMRREAIEEAKSETELITAQQMVDVVTAGRMVSPGDSIPRDLWLALRYILTRDPDLTDWEQVLEDLTDIED